MAEFKNTWRPNHSGTFNNRVNVHGVDDKKLFVIEHYSHESIERLAITNKIIAAPELLEALHNCFDFPCEDLEAWAHGSEPVTITVLPAHIKQVLLAINKAIGGTNND